MPSPNQPKVWVVGATTFPVVVPDKRRYRKMITALIFHLTQRLLIWYIIFVKWFALP
jgi:hypothetical protein